MGFIGLFTVGGLTGLFLASLAVDVHLNQTYFVVAHFHYVMVGGATLAYLGGLHFWWPKMTGRMYPENWARLAAAITFIGFNLTFFPQFIAGYMGMPRRYHYYPRRVSGVARPFDSGFVRAGLRLSAASYLSDLVAEVRRDRRTESLGREGPGVDDSLPAALP